LDKIKETPLYQIIINDIQGLIAAEKFDLDKPICTEKSLCEQYNVSRITAKHALKKLETDGLLYRKRGVGSFVAPSSAGVVSVTNKVFALIIPFVVTQAGMFMAVEAASQIFSRLRHQLTIHISHSAEQDAELLRQLYNQGVDGVIYYQRVSGRASGFPNEALNRFVENNIPVIVLDKTSPLDHISSVVCDHYRGGYMLAEHLISYGHKQICYLSRYTPEVSTIHDRYTAYVDCLHENNIDIQPQFVHWNFNERDGYHMLKHLVNNLHLDGVTAIICENDEVAFNVYMCCGSLGIRIPEDMNITGFDNIEWATTGSARITTIDQNFPLIGEAVANALLQEKYSPQCYTVPVQLIPRYSTGKTVKQV